MEVGYRSSFGAFDLDAALFRVDSDNEIVFDPFSPLGLFGANVNAGEARREGVEVALRGRPGRRFRPFATATFIDAELRDGNDDGNTLPLVPDERFTAGLDFDLFAGLALARRGHPCRRPGAANDEANEQQELDAYDVVNLRATWRPGERKASGGGRTHGLMVFAELRNALRRGVRHPRHLRVRLLDLPQRGVPDAGAGPEIPGRGGLGVLRSRRSIDRLRGRSHSER